VKTLQENVYRELLLRQRINEAAKPSWWPIPAVMTWTI
jgi:phage-related baseplate assembly protein